MVLAGRGLLWPIKVKDASEGDDPVCVTNAEFLCIFLSIAGGSHASKYMSKP